MHVDNADERRVSINIVIYHLLNAYKQQKAGKRFVKKRKKNMRSSPLCLSRCYLSASFSFSVFLSFFVFWPGFSVSVLRLRPN